MAELWYRDVSATSQIAAQYPHRYPNHIVFGKKIFPAVYTIVSEHAVIAQKLGVADNARSSNRAAIVRSPIPYVYAAPLGKTNGADKNAAIKSTKYLPMR